MLTCKESGSCKGRVICKEDRPPCLLIAPILIDSPHFICIGLVVGRVWGVAVLTLRLPPLTWLVEELKHSLSLQGHTHSTSEVVTTDS